MAIHCVKKKKEIMGSELVKYNSFIRDIKDLVLRHQYDAMKAVNLELMQLYWEIGREIYCQQLEHDWGDSVVEVLSKELQKEFPGVRGFSTRNLWLMRNFFIEYSRPAILQSSTAEMETPILKPFIAEVKKATLPPFMAEISWSKNYIIMQKCKTPTEREFYTKMTKHYGWTNEVLINNIENKAFEKYLTNQTNFDETVPEKYRFQAKLAVKDDYNFDFIEMGIEHSEAELEREVINNIQAFLSEMGGYFSFIGSQHRIDVDGDDYYIDLLLYHRRLRCLIAIDLKIGEFRPEHAGKMQFYLSALDETMKLPDENPSIGVIICKSKSRTKVEYTLRSTSKPIGVATYSYYDNMPDEMRSMLPSPERIADIVRNMNP
ncbi:hypothetical protein Mpt1_c08400 [Candidatus Methanoplasma termitum]|uniref:DUF1016 domain-containing protein n=1 Tax=Candidatus Methanoplasma termitum TaxID=1577791 RepID=A0A0A7LEI2_9ARCH|nr:PDDEXK nuclease domain-containing protein [Candidatus Methanoplasma termitum]AIZ56717.1 hypothetical protein Mpt1_c08400 [Candidatus Methanoplasma termitum]